MKKKIVNPSAAKEMDQIVALLGEMFTEVHNAFMKNRLSLRYEQVSVANAMQIRQSLVTFYEAVAKMGGGEALTVQSTALNLSKIFYDLLRLSKQVEIKVKEKVLFGEEAVSEMNNIMIRTVALLPHVADALSTCNELIINHVENEADELRANAASSTAFHEDRLCKGKCHPKASIIYLQMLQHLQDILWHFKALVCTNGMPSM